MTDQREALRVLIHAEICDRRASHDMTLGRCADVALRTLAALPSTPQPEGLDVERLAEAVRSTSVWRDDDAFIEVWREEAENIAAEYARLAPPPPGTSDD